jgi:hypothetical protein
MSQDAPITNVAAEVTRRTIPERVSYRRRGKIASLPFEIRTRVNILLRDGNTYRKVCDWLAKQPDTPKINEENVSKWFNGGHQDWLKEQKTAEEMTLRTDAARALVLEFSGKQTDLESANSLMLASTINGVMLKADPEALKALMAENPKQFFSLARTINQSAGERSRRMEAELKLKKYQDAVAEQKAAIEKALASKSRKGGLSAEALRQIEEAANLL